MHRLRWLGVIALSISVTACASRFGPARFVPAPIPRASASRSLSFLIIPTPNLFDG